MVEICVCRRQQQRIARALSAVHLRAQRGENQPQLAPRALGPVRGALYPPDPCVAFAYRARSEIFASIFSFLTSSHLARSARSGAFHSLLNRRGGYFLQWLRLRVAACLERAPAFVH